ncbi:MAG: hypothetical protein Q7S78_00205 [Candidatus Azambacteria bacterium]|nr:hypothetical protein [Candidatus Azambacteria bacterium]
MRLKEKLEARRLRSLGHSFNEIHKKLGVAKSSVSLWVGNIRLTPEQKLELSQKGIQKGIIEQRRTTRLRNESAKRQIIIDAATKEIKNLSERELWLIGIMLYWAEGGKTQRGLVRFSNSDPEMIRIIMTFFRRICNVPEEKFRGYIHIHPHLDYKKAEEYWSGVSGIPLNKFFKTYRKMNPSSKNKKDNLPFGTFDAYVLSTELFLKISGWAKGIFESSHNFN